MKLVCSWNAHIETISCCWPQACLRHWLVALYFDGHNLCSLPMLICNHCVKSGKKNYLWCCFALFVTSLTNNRRNPRSFSLHLAFPLPTTLAFCECTLNKLNVFKSWIRQFHHCSFSETKYRSTHQIVEANEETSLSKWPLDLSIIIYVNKSYNQCEGPNILGKLDVLKHKWCLVSEG